MGRINRPEKGNLGGTTGFVETIAIKRMRWTRRRRTTTAIVETGPKRDVVCVRLDTKGK